MSGPIERMLAGLGPEAVVSKLPVPPTTGLPWTVRYGSVGGEHDRVLGGLRSVLSLLSLLGLAGLAGGLAIILLRNLMAGNADPALVLGGGFVTLVLVGLAWPMLMRRMRRTVKWQRDAIVEATQVRVTDTREGVDVIWCEPLSAYRDIHHRIGFSTVDAGAAAMAASVAPLDIIELRHPDPGRTILLRMSHQTQTGGMDMMTMIQTARAGGKAAMQAVVGSRVNPEVEQFLAAATAVSGMPVTRDDAALEALNAG